MPLPVAAALGYGITALGLGATAYDGLSEYEKYKRGESVFNTEDQRSAYIRSAFLAACEKNPLFSSNCPKEKDDEELENVTIPTEFYLGVFAIGMFMLLIIIKIFK